MKTEKRSAFALASSPLKVALFIALGTGFWLIKGYTSLIIVAMIMAFVFTPVYKWLQKRVKSNSLAATYTLLITVLAIGIPFFIVLAITIVQAGSIINDVSSTFTSEAAARTGSEALNWLNQILGNITGGKVVVTSDEIWDALSKISVEIASFVLDTLKSWIGGIGSLVTGVILYMYIFTGILVHQDKLTELIKELNPLGDKISDVYLTRTGAMTKAMIRGQFIIAIIQGVESALVLHIAGTPYFAFFVMILTILSIIPLGAGIVTIPIGIINILIGNFWQGGLILLNHFLIVTNIDNVLKPKLVPKSVRLHPALLLLSIFAGVGAFGFLGIIIGPVIMILITSTIEVYLKVATGDTQETG